MIRSLTVAATVLLAACGSGPRVITGAAPGVLLESLDTNSGNVRLRLIATNHNDRSMHLHHLRLHAEVDGADLFDREWPLDLDIGARGRERLNLETAALEAGLEKLRTLPESNRMRISYRLRGEATFDRNRVDAIDRSGFLHPVPGRPGRFR